MAKVYVKFPKTGLGNMLLVWANALVFAKINALEIGTSSWWGFHWGSILRGEKKKRIYHNYFKETPLRKKTIFTLNCLTWNIERNPQTLPIENLNNKNKTLFLFDKIITHENLFLGLYPYRDYILEKLYQNLNPSKMKQLAQFEISDIAVHIRRGDFKLGNPITPLSFFIKAIELIRQVKGADISVTVFSDAALIELEEILSLPNVKLTEEKADILDILLMSKSKILILSQSSTFSYWAAFLSDAFVIMSHYDWQKQIKPSEGDYREFRWNPEVSNSTEELENLILKNDFKV